MTNSYACNISLMKKTNWEMLNQHKEIKANNFNILIIINYKFIITKQYYIIWLTSM